MKKFGRITIAVIALLILGGSASPMFAAPYRHCHYRHHHRFCR